MMDRRLQSYLEPIARAQRRYELWRALTVCWAAITGIALGCLLLRRLAGWSSSWAFPFLVVTAVTAAAVLVRRSRRRGADYRQLARLIEAENPALHARLLTAVEQQPDPVTGRLNYFQERVIGEALAHHHAQPWEQRLLDSLSRIQAMHWLAFAVMLLVTAGLRSGMPTVHRLLATRSNGVAVSPGDASLERGSPLVVLARFDGKLPPEATLVLKPLNETERRLPLTKNLDDPVFGGAVSEVNQDLSYRIEFPTGRTRDFKVAVFDYPRLERADARIVFPSYTGLSPRIIPDTRRISAVEGSLVDYTFYLNKPVSTARLVARDQTALPLTVDTNNASVFHLRLTLEQSRRLELALADRAGRTNKVPPEFVLDALSNRPPELKLTSPRGDPRVSPLEEIAFQAEASDDFGLRAYGIAYALGGGMPKVVQLGQGSGANEKRQWRFLLPLETLGAQPEQLLSYYLWADDVGPDGHVRRTTSDLFFAEVRPFEEVFREGQMPEGGMSGASGDQQQSPTTKLADLQRQIVSATWNVKRRETGAKPSPRYVPDMKTVHESQQQALEQLKALRERLEDPRLRGVAEAAGKAMTQAASSLDDATRRNSLAPLAPALRAEQSAAQAVLRLQARESQVARGRGGGGGGGSASQRMLDQLDLKQADNRYETQRQAEPAQRPEQREQLQVLNRLKELARRQQDLNARLKELQSALEAARTEPERQEVRRQLKRLRDEQQEMLADVDELRQRMDRPENQSRMADARQQLDQARSEVQRAGQDLERDSVSQALSNGTRAQRGLQQLEDQLRKQTSSQFADDLRQMRNDARQLAQRQADLSKQLDDLAAPKLKRLNDAGERRNLADQFARQKSGVTNLLEAMRRVSEQSETAEPLLSRQLYDLLRQSRPDELDKSLDMSSELVRRGFLPQAGPFEQRAQARIDELKRGVEHAAESVLGDETEALRLAKRELDDLSRQLDQELNRANATGSRGTNTPAALPPSPWAPSASGRTNASGGKGAGSDRAVASAPSPSSTPSTSSEAAAGNANSSGNQRNGSEGSGSRLDRLAGIGGGDGRGGGGGGEYFGPLTGNDFIDWSDRLRDVEEILDAPDLRTEVARVRDRARLVRRDFRGSGRKPDWAVVRAQIASPLAEVRARVAEDLARRESKDALVPIDRDPVPARFSELVRRYYEQLGQGQDRQAGPRVEPRSGSGARTD
ncbi:MAG: hypothetical protein KGS61_00345 [Verrucomicrobia bacterium]|nr:hypothetical protein [Verrucomicrobiota bacterium]